MVRPTVLPSYRPNGRWDGSAVGHQAHAFHFLFEGVGRIYGSQIHGTQCRGPDIVCHGSRVLELADQRLVVGSPWRGARLLAGHWLAWLAIVRDVAVEPMVRFRFFFFFNSRPNSDLALAWVRL